VVIDGYIVCLPKTHSVVVPESFGFAGSQILADGLLKFKCTLVCRVNHVQRIVNIEPERHAMVGAESTFDTAANTGEIVELRLKFWRVVYLVKWTLSAAALTANALTANAASVRDSTMLVLLTSWNW